MVRTGVATEPASPAKEEASADGGTPSAAADDADATAAADGDESGDGEKKSEKKTSEPAKPSPPILLVGKARVGRMRKAGDWAWSAETQVSLSALCSGIVRPAAFFGAGAGARFMFGGEHDPMPPGITAGGVDGRGTAFEGYKPMAASKRMRPEDLRSPHDLPVIVVDHNLEADEDEQKADKAAEDEASSLAFGLRRIRQKGAVQL
jgi:hypothetical protein